MHKLTLILATAALLPLPASFAGEPVPPDVADKLSTLVPGVDPDSINASPVPNLYEVVFGPHIVYVSADGRYLLRGDLVDLETKSNLTEVKRRRARAAAIEKLGEATMIVFAPKVVEHTVTIFTDVDCPYCVQLHREVPELNRRGIKVRYLAFPRAGIPSGSYDKMVSVWCADDGQQAITDAKFGKPVTPEKCANPVRAHYEMGQLVGVNGTPTIVLEDGAVLPGYVPAKRLAQVLDSQDGG